MTILSIMTLSVIPDNYIGFVNQKPLMLSFISQLGITTCLIVDLIVTLSINDSQPNNTQGKH